MAEFGLVIPQGLRHVFKRLPGVLQVATNELSGQFRLLMVY